MFMVKKNSNKKVGNPLFSFYSKTALWLQSIYCSTGLSPVSLSDDMKCTTEFSGGGLLLGVFLFYRYRTLINHYILSRRTSRTILADISHKSTLDCTRRVKHYQCAFPVRWGFPCTWLWTRRSGSSWRPWLTTPWSAVYPSADNHRLLHVCNLTRENNLSKALSVGEGNCSIRRGV